MLITIRTTRSRTLYATTIMPHGLTVVRCQACIGTAATEEALNAAVVYAASFKADRIVQAIRKHENSSTHKR